MTGTDLTPTTPAIMTGEQMAAKLMFHVKHEAMDELSRFEALLNTHNSVMNLVGPATLGQYWSRHVLDSAQLLHHAPKARRWADLGAGAGFPGVVLAILLKHMSTGLDLPSTETQVFLIDSLAKRCRFLSEIVQEFNLPATVMNARAETIKLDVDIVTARAMAPLPKLLSFSQAFFKRGAEGLFLKGESVDTEINDAKSDWVFEALKYPSLSDHRGRILHIRSLKRAP
jgi:16S rRNA (guanine527-N7)-methyltransferase